MKTNAFPFDFRKAIQAIGVLHSAEKVKQVPYYRLLKNLYIANREFLRDTGRPIIGGKNVAMDRGPLSSPVYSLVTGEHQDSAEWQKYFVTDGRYLKMAHNPGTDELSKKEIRKLHQITEKFFDRDDDEIGLITHNFDEYKKNYVEGTSTPIPLGDLIAALGITDKESFILEDLDRLTATQQIFSE